MTLSTFYKYAAIVLLLLNVAMVSFFLITKPKEMGPRDQGSGGKAHELLNLDEEQGATFKRLANANGVTMDSLKLMQNELIRPLFKQLTTGPDMMLDNDDRLRQFEELEGIKIKVLYNHFAEVKAILKPDQHADFEEFMNVILRRKNTQDRQRPPRRPRDR